MVSCKSDFLRLVDKFVGNAFFSGSLQSLDWWTGLVTACYGNEKMSQSEKFILAGQLPKLTIHTGY